MNTSVSQETQSKMRPLLWKVSEKGRDRIIKFLESYESDGRVLP